MSRWLVYVLPKFGVVCSFHFRETGTVAPENLCLENVLNLTACAPTPRQKYIRDWVLLGWAWNHDLYISPSPLVIFTRVKKYEIWPKVLTPVEFKAFWFWNEATYQCLKCRREHQWLPYLFPKFDIGCSPNSRNKRSKTAHGNQDAKIDRIINNSHWTIVLKVLDKFGVVWPSHLWEALSLWGSSKITQPLIVRFYWNLACVRVCMLCVQEGSAVF